MSREKLEGRSPEARTEVRSQKSEGSERLNSELWAVSTIRVSG